MSGTTKMHYAWWIFIGCCFVNAVCETKTRKEIAQELFLSEGTVKRHISEILAKTGYDNILRLAVHAVSSGLIVPKMRDEKEPR